MSVNILFAAPDAEWAGYEAHLPQALAARGIEDFRLARDLPAKEVDVILYAPNGRLVDFSPYHRCTLVQSLWAGVDKIVGNESLTQPLCRMVDPGLQAGMIEYVVGHVLRHHLGMDRHIVNPDHVWDHRCPSLASERPIAMLGFGALGQASAEALAGLGFPVRGWSRTAKTHTTIPCFSGVDGLRAALDDAQGVVTLLPATSATTDILNAQTLAWMAPGAFVINPGRGTLIHEDALIQALDSGQIGHATLDVFRREPLAPDHPFWSHPKVTVTPHIAADTRPETASVVVAENIVRMQNGRPLLHLVDCSQGY